MCRREYRHFGDDDEIEWCWIVVSHRERSMCVSCVDADDCYSETVSGLSNRHDARHREENHSIVQMQSAHEALPMGSRLSLRFYASCSID